MNLVGCNRDFKKTSERIYKETDSIKNEYLRKLNFQTSKKTAQQAEISVKKFASGYVIDTPKKIELYVNGELITFKNNLYEDYLKLRREIETQSNKISETRILISHYKQNFQSDSDDIKEVDDAINRLNRLYFGLDSMCNNSRADLLKLKYLTEKYKKR